MDYSIYGEEIYLEKSTLKNAYINVKNNKIVSIGENKGGRLIELKGLKILPGLIDIHLHGGSGFDLMDEDYQSINELSKYKLKEGVTSFCPATVTTAFEKMTRILDEVKKAKSIGVEGARLLGAFLEGPYINKKMKGAHNEDYIKDLEQEELNVLIANYQDVIISVALAPENENSLDFIEQLVQSNINVRIGHSYADYQSTRKAIQKGANIGIHTYNAMRELNHREIGILGEIFLNEKIYAEIICDFIHVQKEAIQILRKMKGPDKIILITDCMSAGGLNDGSYLLGDLPVDVKDGIARTKNGNLAGSTLQMNIGLKNYIEVVKDFHEGVNAASINPAIALDCSKDFGSIAPGKSADIIGLNDKFDVNFVMCDGKIKIDNYQLVI